MENVQSIITRKLTLSKFKIEEEVNSKVELKLINKISKSIKQPVGRIILFDVWRPVYNLIKKEIE